MIPEWSSASDLISQSSVFHATNWAGLHESVSELNVSSVLLRSESASKVSVVSEEIWMVLSPFEINVEKNNFFFIDIGEFRRLLLNIWLSIVININIVWIELTIWVHDINGEWIEVDTLTIDIKL